jgi:thioesterase domain-containing protein
MITEQLIALQSTLNHEIPLSVHLGVQVSDYHNRCLTLTAPLAPNINHKDTAFAGSLNAILTLAGWSHIWLLLHEYQEEAKIVIQSSNIQYLEPVVGSIVAVSSCPEEKSINRFLRMLRERKIGRIDMQCDVQGTTGTAVSFHGRYIAHRPGFFLANSQE